MAIKETVLREIIAKDPKETTYSSTDATVTHPLQVTENAELPEVLELPEDTKEEIDSLNKISTAQTKLTKVKESLGSIIDTIAANPSLFTRAATAWGELPLWQKIVGGVVLTGPTLAVGLFAHVSVLLVVGGVTGITYTASAIVLDDHHTCNVNIAARLREGIISLADVLQLTIEALDTIRQELAKEIDRFKEQNFKLTENVTELGDKVEQLTNQVELFVETEKLLRATKDDLETTVKSLKESITDQSGLLEKNQQELSKVKIAYEKSQQQLSLKVAELHKVRVEMGLEVKKVQAVASTMKVAVNTLTDTVVSNDKQKEEFKRKFDTFLSDKSASFDNVSNRIHMAEEELAAVKEELKVVTTRYQQLLDRQESQVVRMERLDPRLNRENLPPKVNTKGLRQNGLYINNKPPLQVVVAPDLPMTQVVY